jgi:hypothetical protein
MKTGIRKPNNGGVAGLVTTTAGPDLCHTLPAGRTAKIRKIMWSNHTGAAGNIIFGTQDNAGVWVPLLPTIQCINGFDGELPEIEIPEVEFRVDRTPAPAGLTGNILVQASIVGILIRLEVEEFGA